MQTPTVQDTRTNFADRYQTERAEIVAKQRDEDEFVELEKMSQQFSAREEQEEQKVPKQTSLEARISFTKQISNKIKRSNTINSDADAAAHRRSQITGKLRMLSSARSMTRGMPQKEDLGFLFGGSAKPKMATTKVNVRKEKEKALGWIRDELKKYD